MDSRCKFWGWVLSGVVLVGLLGLPGIPGVSAATTIQIARPTWDTGWFQAEVFRALLQELGYTVSEPKTLENADFYRAVADGEVDLWASGWFPSHNRYLNRDDLADRIEVVGFEVPGGALQGYLVDKATADRFNIRNLGDLADPDIAAEFDMDGDRKADLIGCNQGWSCAEIIDQHLAAYGLTETVDHRQGVHSDGDERDCSLSSGGTHFVIFLDA